MHYVITIALKCICVNNVFLYMLLHELTNWERRALSESKLFTSLCWFSYITGLGVTQIHLLRLFVSVCGAVKYVEDKQNTWLSVLSRDKCLHLPGAAGVSGIVKPFKQLWVWRHSNFNHVGVRLHLKGPIVSAKRTEITMRLVIWTHFLICHPTSLVQKSPHSDGWNIHRVWMEADNDGWEMIV